MWPSLSGLTTAGSAWTTPPATSSSTTLTTRPSASYSDDHRLRARRTQLRDLAGRPRGGGDLVTCRDQPGNEVPSQRPSRSRDEDSHDRSFRVVLSPSLEDKAPPEAVTLFNPVFRTASSSRNASGSSMMLPMRVVNPERMTSNREPIA